MLTRTALLLTVLATLGQPALARPASLEAARSHTIAEHGTRPQPQPGARATPSAVLKVILPPATDDIRAGRGPYVHARALRQIAIDEAIGNIDGAEILKAQLHDAGVGNDTLDEAVTWAKVHESRPFREIRRPALPETREESASKTMY